MSINFTFGNIHRRYYFKLLILIPSLFLKFVRSIYRIERKQNISILHVDWYQNFIRTKKPDAVEWNVNLDKIEMSFCKCYPRNVRN